MSYYKYEIQMTVFNWMDIHYQSMFVGTNNKEVAELAHRLKTAYHNKIIKQRTLPWYYTASLFGWNKKQRELYAVAPLVPSKKHMHVSDNEVYIVEWDEFVQDLGTGEKEDVVEKTTTAKEAKDILNKEIKCII